MLLELLIEILRRDHVNFIQKGKWVVIGDCIAQWAEKIGEMSSDILGFFDLKINVVLFFFFLAPQRFP